MRAFTVIEVVIASVVLAMITMVSLSLTMSGQDLAATSGHRMKASSRALSVADRIISELRMATISGEDVDDNDDESDLLLEDRNGNGRIDDDWSLADGETETFISFNIMQPGAIVSDVVRFSFDGNQVIRESGTDASRQAVIATDIDSLTFTREGRIITISIVARSGRRAASDARRGAQVTLEREVLIRN